MDHYQNFWRRFWASVIDGLVLTPVTLLDGYVRWSAKGGFAVVACGIVAYSGYYVYSVLMHARWGQTLGKMVTAVKVMDVSERRLPTLRQAFMRNLGYIVLSMGTLGYLTYLVAVGRYAEGGETLGLPGEILTWAAFGWLVLEFVSMLTNRKRRAVHDLMAGTVVVRLD